MTDDRRDTQLLEELCAWLFTWREYCPRKEGLLDGDASEKCKEVCCAEEGAADCWRYIFERDGKIDSHAHTRKLNAEGFFEREEA